MIESGVEQFVFGGKSVSALDIEIAGSINWVLGGLQDLSDALAPLALATGLGAPVAGLLASFSLGLEITQRVIQSVYSEDVGRGLFIELQQLVWTMLLIK